MRWSSILAGFIGVLALNSCSPADKNPELQLRLTVSRKHWYVGEYPWYLLQLKNVGVTSATLSDSAFFLQSRLSSDPEKTSHISFEIVGPDGLPRTCCATWGLHGERSFWTNECGDNCKGPWNIALEPGEIFNATPSVQKPVRVRNDASDSFDLRDLPKVAGGDRHTKQGTLRERWRKSVESIWLLGTPRLKLDTAKALAEIPPGYRILEGVDLDKPGTYKLKVVYDARCPEADRPSVQSTPIHEGSSAKLKAIEGKLLRAESFDKQTKAELQSRRKSECRKAMRLESNEVEIEVEPAPSKLKGPGQSFEIKRNKREIESILPELDAASPR
ncbi:MAG: hypothetical protein HY925_15590 [Elusimicrobia bacterium]|nr:hypothetical protein [Elusimicrobiota bacterium]